MRNRGEQAAVRVWAASPLFLKDFVPMCSNYLKKNIYYFFKVLIFFAILMIFDAFCNLAQAKIIVFEEQKMHKMLYLHKVNEGDRVELHYIHSLYNVEQREIYYVINQKFLLVKIYFGSYDAALYYNEDPIGGIKKLNQEFYINTKEILSEVAFILAGNYSHILYINGIAVDPYVFAKPTSFIRLFIKKL